MPYAMTTAEREAFLREPRVAVLAVPREGRGPLSSPVWYDYEPGGSLWFLTQTTSQKGRLLVERPRVSLTMQTETSPYAYVSIEGPVISIEPYDFEADLLPMAVRYRGAEAGRAYVDNAKAAPRERPASETCIKVWVQAEQWLTVDYAKRGE